MMHISQVIALVVDVLFTTLLQVVFRASETADMNVGLVLSAVYGTELPFKSILSCCGLFHVAHSDRSTQLLYEVTYLLISNAPASR